jgi:hypothetical protein
VGGIMRTAKLVPKRLMAAFPAVIGGAAIFRLDQLFANKVTDLVGVQADSAGGKGVRAVSFIAAGVLVDGILGRKKRFNWSWGELITNIGLIKIAQEVFEDNIEPAIFGTQAPGTQEGTLESFITEALPPASVDPTGGTVQQGSPAAATNGFMGRGRMGRGRMGALVEAAPPVFG